MKTPASNGYSQNIHNFKLMATFIKTMGPNYNPPIEVIKPAKLEAKLASAEAAQAAFETATITRGATASRLNDLFASHDSIVTRSYNAFKIFDPQTGIMDQAHNIVRDMRGKTATERLTEKEIAAEKEKGNIINQNATHKSTVPRKIEFFSKWTSFLKAQPYYKPNEEDITAEALEQRLENYRNAENANIEATAAVEIARNNRNLENDDDNTGIVALSATVKNYVKAAFGTTSAEYKYISSIKFKKISR